MTESHTDVVLSLFLMFKLHKDTPAIVHVEGQASLQIHLCFSEPVLWWPSWSSVTQHGRCASHGPVNA